MNAEVDVAAPPQWAPDPTGRHVQRYWDGADWTAFVASGAGGEPAVDPYSLASPAQWAPDPTGRYVQRYWDGDSWTDYVATAAGGEPATDPLDDRLPWAAPVVIPAGPGTSASEAAADVRPRAEPVGVAAGRRPVRRLAWLGLGLALAVGVAIALRGGSGDPAPSSASAAAHASTSVPGGGATAGTASPGSKGRAGTGGARKQKQRSTPSSTSPAEAPAATAPAASGQANLPAAKPHSVDQAQDTAAAEQVALARADLPAGWSRASSALSDGLASTAPECAAFHRRLVTNADATVSHDFAKPGQRVSSSVVAMPTQSQASALLEAISDPATAPCLEHVFADAAALGGAVTTEARPVFVRPVGVQRAGVEVVSDGATGTAFTDLVGFRVGRTEVLTTFESAGAPFDGATRDALLSTLAARLAAA